MKIKEGTLRVGHCRHTRKPVLQYRDNYSNDAIDEKGWLCLHQETTEEEIKDILKFKFMIDVEIYLN